MAGLAHLRLYGFAFGGSGDVDFDGRLNRVPSIGGGGAKLDGLRLNAVAHGTAAMETQMIVNHKTAIELLVANVQSVENPGSVNAAGFDRYTLMNLHAALSENLLPNPADEGRIRQHAVEIGKSVFRPLSVPQQIDEALAVLLTVRSRTIIRSLPKQMRVC